MKVAVTGATGFIGRHVLAELEARSVESIALVRNSSSQLVVNSKSSIFQIDLHNSQPNAYELMGKPDVLIHLAWSGLPNYKSLHHFETELPAQYRFIKSLIESGLQNLVVTGTCFEYGMQSGSLSEDIFPQPSNPYGFAKNVLRCQIEYLKTLTHFNFTWARLFYLYGEGQSETSLLPQLKMAVARGDSVFNMSGGEQLRDYISVEEVSRYLVSLALAKKDFGIVNVCSGSPVSIRSLVESWVEEKGWPIRLNLGHYPYPDYEPMAFWGDSKKLSTLVGKIT